MIMEILKGRIVDVEKKVHQAAYLATGKKKHKQLEYDNADGVYGSNGTYVTGFDYYGTSINVKIYVYDMDNSYTFDVRDYILGRLNKSKVSSKLLDYVINNNKGKKVNVNVDGDQIGFNMSQLDLPS